jgi:hypothetical protein
MNPDVEKNYKEKLRLSLLESIQSLDNKFEAMISMHASKGRLRSGSTIKRTMDFIAEENSEIYKVTIGHLKELKINFYPKLESGILFLVKPTQDSFKVEAKGTLKKGLITLVEKTYMRECGLR